MKRKSVLSLYMSKRRRKRRRKEGEGRYVGRPKILSNPLPNKDLDSTVPFINDFSTEECETDIYMPINQRAISTVGIESFFSELTSMEFSGLGCPKAVDIPKLISHVTELNSIRHDSGRGFVSNTTNRGSYPYVG